MTEQTTRPLNLTDIEARANAATKGPWGFYDGDNYAEVAADMQVTSPGSCNYRERVARLEDEDYWDDQEHDGHDEERAPEQMVANAAFIAAARTDVPALLAEVRRLQAQRKYLLAQLAKKDARSGEGDRALREFLTVHPDEVEMAASLARDGFGPDEITVMLSSPPAAAAAGESGSTR